MKEGPDIARIAVLIGDPARANMLGALMNGKALTATELAQEAGITPQTTSSHLSKLCEGGLLKLHKQGRHRYFSLANDDVARMLESLMGVAAAAGHLRTRTGPKDNKLRKARVCYNHLAGDMGTRMFDALIRNSQLHPQDGGIRISRKGERLVRDLGIDLESLSTQRAPLCRECLDWSERRSHLAGSLGRALLTQFEKLGWARRDRSSRAIHFTPSGEKRFNDLFQTPKA